MKPRQRTQRAIWLCLVALVASSIATAQDDTEDADTADAETALAEARAELERARAELEAAAREVAALSAQHLERIGPVIFRAPFGERRPLLGLNIENADAGVRVAGVTPNGVADRAGIRTGDVIVAIDAIALTADDDRRPISALLDRLADVEPGATVALEVERNGERLAIEAQTSDQDTAPGWLGDLAELGPTIRGVTRLPRPSRGSWLGNLFAGAAWRDMELVELTPALGEYFGTAEGLLVVRAPADDAIGLVDGDVILSIGGRTPSSVEHAMRILASFEPSEPLEIAIMREQRRRTLPVALPARDENGENGE